GRRLCCGRTVRWWSSPDGVPSWPSSGRGASPGRKGRCALSPVSAGWARTGWGGEGPPEGGGRGRGGGLGGVGGAAGARGAGGGGGGMGGGGVVVVDYGEPRSGLGDLLRAVLDDPGRVRVLLLARSLGEWWDRLAEESPATVARLLGEADPIRLDAPVTGELS